ncbi:hypothetical protein [Brevibacillus brevis]|uniref:Uncharacterized protein n=1 Tax=Brevibacillus brevis TaxID=1393 RepID=A0ABY9T1C5_BREBE|nr:hypothetical protein [Brevibacillus brevis]WNC13796.1 hypothetical protein RGB73_24420 [Brevibacillus brevis]
MKNHRFRRQGFSLFMALLILICSPSPATACSCSVGTATEELQKAKAVFSGTVSELREGEEAVEAVLDVKSTWKGEVQSTRIVHSPFGSCQYPFELGPTYLVYAKQRDDSSPYVVHDCGRTSLVSSAYPDILELEFGPNAARSIQLIQLQFYALHKPLYQTLENWHEKVKRYLLLHPHVEKDSKQYGFYSAHFPGE